LPPTPRAPASPVHPTASSSALSKLDAYAQRIPIRQPNPAQNNLFIVEPFAGGSRTLVNLFATHPPTERRIAELRQM
jgi:heat shock protein HtpX